MPLTWPMKQKLACIGFAALCGCASQSQTSIGDDTYLIQAQGRINQESVGSVMARAMDDAKETCRANDYKYMSVLDRQTAPGNAFAGRPAEVVLEVKYFQNEGKDRRPCN
jgi:hypothetical protein